MNIVDSCLELSNGTGAWHGDILSNRGPISRPCQPSLYLARKPYLVRRVHSILRDKIVVSVLHHAGMATATSFLEAVRFPIRVVFHVSNPRTGTSHIQSPIIIWTTHHVLFLKVIWIRTKFTFTSVLTAFKLKQKVFFEAFN